MSVIEITNVTVVDGHGARTEGATLVIDGDRIAQVATATFAHPADDWQVIDGQGCSVMPGMFNCHYHASYRNIGSTGLPIGMEGSPGYLTLGGAYNIALALNSGFTSVISAGAPHAIDASLRKAVDEGLIPGPRVMVGSRDVSTTAHSQDRAFPWYWEGGQHPGIAKCDGPDGFRRGVREEIKRGAEYIKIFATAGHAVKGDPELLEVSPDELAAAIHAAHERGVRVRAHIANKRAIMTAVELGIDAIDHGDGLDEECIQAMAKRGTVLAPSCFFPYRVAQNASGPGIDFMVSEMRAMLDMLPAAHAAGVKIVLGDDYGTLALPHGMYGQELAFYVEHAKVSPRDVITWATVNGAAMMGKADELGDLKPGMLADLLIVKGDPIADIGLLGDPANVLTVMKAGKLEKNSLPVRHAREARQGRGAATA